MSREIEAKVLAAVMSDRFLLTKVVNDGFGPDHFRDQNHRILFKTVYDMSQVPGQVVDWITLENTLKRKGWASPEIAQSIVRLRKAEAPEADQLMAYVDILKDESLREGMRKLAAAMTEYCERGGEHKNEEFLDFNSRVIQGLIALQKQKVKKRVSPVKETINEIRELTNRPKTPEKQTARFFHQAVRAPGAHTLRNKERLLLRGGWASKAGKDHLHPRYRFQAGREKQVSGSLLHVGTNEAHTGSAASRPRVLHQPRETTYGSFPRGEATARAGE